MCVSVYIDTEGQTACLQPPRLDQLAWISTAVRGLCVCVCVLWVAHWAWFYHCYTINSTPYRSQSIHTRFDPCPAVYDGTNWFQWKQSLKWWNLGSQSSNKTTHSDMFFSLLLGFWLQLPGIIQMRTTSQKNDREVSSWKNNRFVLIPVKLSSHKEECSAKKMFFLKTQSNIAKDRESGPRRRKFQGDFG